MKAIRIHEAGGPEVLKYEDCPDPTPGPGQALIDVQAIGVNFTDVVTRRGGANPPTSFPMTPGMEAAGVVSAVGEGVTEARVGARPRPEMRSPFPLSALPRLPGPRSL